MAPQVTLPDYVALKGDNGNFLAAAVIRGKYYHQFTTVDIHDEKARHQVIPLGDKSGNVFIKSVHRDKFWRRGTNDWIFSDADTADASNNDMLFQPVKLDDYTVALQCLGNSRFCKRYTVSQTEIHCLSAKIGTIDEFSRFKVVEPVFERKVHSVVYDVKSAQIWEEPLVLAQNKVTNTSNRNISLRIPLTSTDKKSREWSNSVSFITDIDATMTTGIPEIESSGVMTVSQDTTFKTKWGEVHPLEGKVETTYAVPAEPGQTVTVKLTGKRAKFEVKFSYVEEVKFATGKPVVIKKDDGVFHGMNYFGLRHEVL